MKTTIKLACLALVLICMSFKSKAQFYPLQNLTNCDVDIIYEMWDAGCGVCASGTLSIPPGGVVNLTMCPGFMDICIVITDVGGCPVPVNHSSINVCHVLTPYGQNGVTAAGCCSPGMPWNATQGASGWTIN